ncbi:MAG: serine protease [Lachnospiraceae bacterium]|nr:serine protease [Lachnospiraceae bacterium]
MGMEIRYKEKPLNYKRTIQRICIAAICGAVFAIVALLVLFCFRSQIRKMLGAREENRIVFETEATGQEALEEDWNSEERVDMGQNSKYAEAFYEKAFEANNFLVGINEVSAEGYGGKKTYTEYACGIIMYQSKKELLILSTPNAIRGTNIVQITFFNGQTVSGEVLRTDQETGISVVSVQKKVLDKDTKKSVTVAKFGKSSTLHRGEYTAAIGNPLKEHRSIVVGQYTAVGGKTRLTDREYTLLETNIVGRRHTAGFLLDANTNVIGIISHREDEEGEAYTVKALGISDLSWLLDALCNNRELPFMGVQISTVSEETSRAYDIPSGAYVEYVYLRSPAVDAGIQRGDILVSMGKREIRSAKQFTEALMELSPRDSVKVQIMRYTNGAYKRVSAEVIISERLERN